jgi:hypothetical protein
MNSSELDDKEVAVILTIVNLVKESGNTSAQRVRNYFEHNLNFVRQQNIPPSSKK